MTDTLPKLPDGYFWQLTDDNECDLTRVEGVLEIATRACVWSDSFALTPVLVLKRPRPLGHRPPGEWEVQPRRPADFSVRERLTLATVAARFHGIYEEDSHG